jgi:hypothetical protein
MQLQTDQRPAGGEMASILHIGMPKTGSTTLQRTLHGSSHILQNHGICYPSNLGSSRASHRIMASKLMPAERFPRHLHRCRQQKRADELYLELKNRVTEARVKGWARQVILSSEILFRLPAEGYKLSFRDSVYDLLGDQFKIVAYLRAPSSAYLALLQQNLKASYTLRPAKPPEYRKVIKSYQNLFGEDRICLRVFDRADLFGDDIVQDFCHHYLPAHGGLADQLVLAGETNVSLSAESMAVCLLFRKRFYGMNDNKHSKLSRNVVSGLRQADALIQAKRPALLASIQAGIDRAAAPQIKWLHKQWGLEFKNYDYSHLNCELDATQLALLDQASSLDKIVRMDVGVIKDLAHLLATKTKLEGVPKVARWSAKLASCSQSEILRMLKT